MRSQIKGQVSQTIKVLEAVLADDSVLEAIERVARVCVDAVRSGNKILFSGNGGSAADSQHLAGEFVSRFAFERPGLAALALTTDTSVLTAIGNDYGYESLFARQIEALGLKGDVLFAISTSGCSPNILAGLRSAREKQIVTVGLSGAKGGEMGPLCDFLIRAPSMKTPRVQEAHISIGHTICCLVESELFSR